MYIFYINIYVMSLVSKKSFNVTWDIKLETNNYISGNYNEWKAVSPVVSTHTQNTILLYSSIWDILKLRMFSQEC